MRNKVKTLFLNSALVLSAFSIGFMGGVALSEKSLRKEFYEDISVKTKEVMAVQEGVLKIKQVGNLDIYLNPVFKVLGMSRNLRGSYSSFFNAAWIDVTDEYIKQVIAHEEGHRYVRNLKEKLELRNNVIENIFSRKTEGEKITDEGIANYFEVAYRTKAEKAGIRYEPLKRGGFHYYKKVDGCPVCYYSAGYSLVKPILDVSVDKGIEALARNPMRDEDLEDLIGYQQRILRIVKTKP